MTRKRYTPRILLIDDDSAFLESTTWLLEDAGFQVSSHPSAGAFLTSIDTNPPAAVEPVCVVTDIRMPDMSGLQLITELQVRKLIWPVIVITGHGDVGLAVETMRNGAASFIEKPFDVDILVAHIQEALEDPGCGLRDPTKARDTLAQLSNRERQVLALVCEGKLNKSIADILGVSIKTVEFHRSKLTQKLGVSTVQDLVKISLGYPC